MSIELLDLEPATADEREEIVAGLRQTPKQISPKFFYDARGSRLFDRICEQPEYYPTRVELGIMRHNIAPIAQALGPRARVIEFGSGSSLKTRLLLKHLEEPAAYVPVDISREHLMNAASSLVETFPELAIRPVCADFTQPFELPAPELDIDRNVVFFPGSTIGNFSSQDAVKLMQVMRAEAGDNGGLLIGVDLIKDRDILEPAYNDAAGVTADFNLNLLERFNREHGADFSIEDFEHRAVFDEQHGRIEMQLVSQQPQEASIGDDRFEFDAGEHIITEHSHKYSIEQFEQMATDAGFVPQTRWLDDDGLFSVQYLQAA